MHRLVEAFGSVEAALESPVEALAAALRVRIEDAARILAEARAADVDGIMTAVERLRARIVLRGDPGYPQLLSVAPDPPALLFVRGSLDGAPEAAVAIVGSRHASAYGRLHAGRIAETLAASGITVVSGGARGIDAEAHRGALRARGRTVAVVASGLQHPYPPEHGPLFDAIVEGGGAVVAEQCPGIEPRAELFPRRNRVVAAMSLVVVVVEAASRSGALLTARIATEDLSREVGCLPGSVDAATSAGCNAAIRDGWARLVRGAEDVLEMLADARALAIGAAERAALKVAARPDCDAPVAASVASRERGRPPPDPGQQGPSAEATTRHRHQDALSGDESAVVEFLARTGAAGLDELEQGLSLGVPRLAAATLRLERQGLVARDAAGAFRRCGGREVRAREGA